MIFIGTRKYKYGRMVLSHMCANTLGELHAMAELLGLKKDWFQNTPGKIPHYDVCQLKKQLALNNGARLVNDRTLVLMYKKREIQYEKQNC